MHNQFLAYLRSRRQKHAIIVTFALFFNSTILTVNCALNPLASKSEASNVQMNDFISLFLAPKPVLMLNEAGRQFFTQVASLDNKTHHTSALEECCKRVIDGNHTVLFDDVENALEIIDSVLEVNKKNVTHEQLTSIISNLYAFTSSIIPLTISLNTGTSSTNIAHTSYICNDTSSITRNLGVDAPCAPNINIGFQHPTNAPVKNLSALVPYDLDSKFLGKSLENRSWPTRFATIPSIGTFTFGGDVSIAGGMDVFYTVTLGQNLVLTPAPGLTEQGMISSSGGTTTVTGTTTFNFVNIHNTLTVTGTTQIKALHVTNASVFDGNLTVSRNMLALSKLDAFGAETAHSSFDVTGTTRLAGASTFMGNATANSNLDVLGSTLLHGSLNVTGTTQHNGNVGMAGTLNVTGATTLSSLTVTGSTATSWLDVLGSTILHKDLTVRGSTTLVGAVGLGAISVTSILDSGTLNVFGATTIHNTMTVTGTTQVKSLHATNSSQFDSNLTVSGNVYLPTTTASAGGIYVNSNRFIHAYGTNNTFMGTNAGNFTLTGDSNVAIGAFALNSTTTSLNTAVGFRALTANTTGRSNTAIGPNSLLANTTGLQNAAIGSGALMANTTGGQNTALGVGALNVTTTSNTVGIGFRALRNNTTGVQNTAVGTNALLNNTTGIQNTAVGYQPLLLNTTGGQNTALGALALNQTTSSLNTAVGSRALAANTTGANNVAIGSDTLLNCATGSGNIAIGDGAGEVLASSESNNIYLGHSGFVGESNMTRIGTSGTQLATNIPNRVLITGDLTHTHTLRLFDVKTTFTMPPGTNATGLTTLLRLNFQDFSGETIASAAGHGGRTGAYVTLWINFSGVSQNGNAAEYLTTASVLVAPGATSAGNCILSQVTNTTTALTGSQAGPTVNLNTTAATSGTGKNAVIRIGISGGSTPITNQYCTVFYEVVSANLASIV